MTIFEGLQVPMYSPYVFPRKTTSLKMILFVARSLLKPPLRSLCRFLAPTCRHLGSNSALLILSWRKLGPKIGFQVREHAPSQPQLRDLAAALLRICARLVSQFFFSSFHFCFPCLPRPRNFTKSKQDLQRTKAKQKGPNSKGGGGVTPQVSYDPPPPSGVVAC